jgi:hypothetical protein
VYPAAVFWAIAGLTRPESLMAPFVAVAFAPLKNSLWRSTAGRFLLVYAGIVALWFVPSLLLTGTVNLSSQRPDQLNRMLHRKGEFLILTLPDGVRQAEWRNIEEIPAPQYSMSDLGALYARHPGNVVVLYIYEVGKLLVRFDEMKIVTYLGIWEPDQEWQRKFVSAPFKFLQSDVAPYLVLAALGSVFWLAIVFFAVRGFRNDWRRREFQLILGLVTYAFASVLTVDNTSARLRSCTNYAFVLFASAGYWLWIERRRKIREAREADK